jgi:cell division protein FtsQ
VIRKKIRRRIVFVILLSAAITSTVLYIGYYSNLLVIKKIDVRGANQVPVQVITDTAQISLNTQLLRVPTSIVVERLTTISQIGRAEVRRGWPSTLVIEVTERIPLALADTPAGRFLVDASGISGPDDASRSVSILAWQSFPDWLKAEVVITNTDNPNSIWFTLTSGRKVIWGDLTKAEEKSAVLKVLRRMAGSIYDVSTPEVPVVKP